MTLEILDRIGDRWHHLWRHLPLKTLGILSALLPMVAVVVSAVLAFAGNENRQRLETAVTRHFEMVSRLDALLTLLLDAETGLRGHLLTGRDEFLDPFVHARKSLPAEMKTLRAFVEGEPGAEPRARPSASSAWRGPPSPSGSKKAAGLPPLSETLLPTEAGDVLEPWSFMSSKANPRWVWIALCRRTRQIAQRLLAGLQGSFPRRTHRFCGKE